MPNLANRKGIFSGGPLCRNGGKEKTDESSFDKLLQVLLIFASGIVESIGTHLIRFARIFTKRI